MAAVAISLQYKIQNTLKFPKKALHQLLKMVTLLVLTTLRAEAPEFPAYREAL